MKRMRYLVLAALLGLGALSVLPRGHEQAQAILTLGGTGAVIDASHYATVQEAIDATPSGGRLYFPSAAGPYQPPDTAGWAIRRPIEIFGDGMATNESVGLQPFGLSKNGTVFQLKGSMGSDFYLHDIVISTGSGRPAANGVGDYIRVSTDTILQRVTIERVRMLYAGRSAMYLPGANYVVGLILRNVFVFECGGHGLFLDNATLVDISELTSDDNGGLGMVMLAGLSGVHIRSSTFEENGLLMDNSSDVTIPEDHGVDYNAELLLVNSQAAIEGCNFEFIGNVNPTFCKNGITLNASRGCVVGGNQFSTSGAESGSKSINLLNTAKNNTILGNIHFDMDYAVYIDNAANDYGNCVLAQYAGSVATNGFSRVNVPTGSYNFAVITNQSATGATNKIVGLLLPNLATNGNRPDSLTDAYSTILQRGLIAFADDSLFIRRASAWVTPP